MPSSSPARVGRRSRGGVRGAPARREVRCAKRFLLLSRTRRGAGVGAEPTDPGATRPRCRQDGIRTFADARRGPHPGPRVTDASSPIDGTHSNRTSSGGSTVPDCRGASSGPIMGWCPTLPRPTRPPPSSPCTPAPASCCRTRGTPGRPGCSSRSASPPSPPRARASPGRAGYPTAEPSTATGCSSTSVGSWMPSTCR